jgi:retinol-binding protein 3
MIMPDSNFSKIRSAVIQDIIRLAREKYVDPEIGENIASQIQKKLADGQYDDITQEIDLAFRLTMDFRSISRDHHWSVAYAPKGDANQVDPEHEMDVDRMARYLEMARKTNYGFERVERLKGNIGYIDLRRFDPSEYGGETAVAAMNFTANCDALIIDIRQNSGGYPSMVQLIISYLFDAKPRHINTFYYRPTNDTQQFWTFPHIPGKRRPDIPVYVLISNITCSAAEEFAYDLRYMERATLVGETTLGAAHPVNKEIVQRDYVVRLPYGRPINPVTGSNWEGSGVEAHIAVPAEEALKAAHLHAVECLAEKCQDENERYDLLWIADIIESDYTHVVLDKTDLSRCAGEFGGRRFLIENGGLFYGHQDVAESWKLLPMTKTRFRLDEDMKFEFILAEDGKASAVKINYRDGRPEVFAERTG